MDPLNNISVDKDKPYLYWWVLTDVGLCSVFYVVVLAVVFLPVQACKANSSFIDKALRRLTLCD